MKGLKIFVLLIAINLSLALVAYVGAQQDETDDTRTPIDIHRIPQTRGMRFVIADKWNKLSLTYQMINCPARLDCEATRGAVRRAFADWAAVSALSFTEVSGRADIELSFTLDDPEFGTEGDVLAFAYFPSDGGDIFFDDAEPWTLHDGGDTDFYVVTLHEIGHSLGLDHSNDPSAIMYAFSGTASTLQRDDILAIQRLYGAPSAGDDAGSVGDTTPPITDQPLPPPIPTAVPLPPSPDQNNETGAGGILDDDFGYEEWVIYAEAGDTVTITMESDTLDSYLILLSPDYQTVLAEDDDSLGDYNAIIIYTFTQTGEYIVIATTYDGWMGGDYTLNVYFDGDGYYAGCDPDEFDCFYDYEDCDWDDEDCYDYCDWDDDDCYEYEDCDWDDEECHYDFDYDDYDDDYCDWDDEDCDFED